MALARRRYEKPIRFLRELLDSRTAPLKLKMVAAERLLDLYSADETREEQQRERQEREAERAEAQRVDALRQQERDRELALAVQAKQSAVTAVDAEADINKAFGWLNGGSDNDSDNG
jgi:hypothetical protein